MTPQTTLNDQDEVDELLDDEEHDDAKQEQNEDPLAREDLTVRIPQALLALGPHLTQLARELPQNLQEQLAKIMQLNRWIWMTHVTFRSLSCVSWESTV